MKTRHAISMSVSVCACVLAACGATPGEEVNQSHQAVTSGDIYNFGALANPGSCMDAEGAGTADGTQIQEWQCNGTGAQSFSLQATGNGNYTIVNTNANKCVDVSGAGTADGTKVQLWDCNGTGAQSFAVQADANGYITFVNTNSNKCLDVSGDDPNNGTVVQLWDCNGTNAQIWNPAVIGGSGTGTSSGGSGNMTVVNQCGYTVWVGVLANAGDVLPVS